MRSLFLLAVFAVPCAAQTTSSGAFMVTLGRDTLAVERFERSAETLRGELVAFSPTTRVIRYTLNLTLAGTVVSGEYLVLPGEGKAGTAPTMLARFDRRDTLMTTVIQRPQRTDTLVVVVPPGTVPMMSPSIAPYEQMVIQAFRQGGDSVGIAFYSVGGRSATPNHVVRRTADSVGVEYFGADHYLAVDFEGRLLGLNGARTTNKMTVERVSGPVDIGALAAAGVAREKAGAAAGALSTRDTLRANVSGADLLVDYGRPSARGREILGEVVPFGEVWRTGANQATHFSTTRDLQVGGAMIPAGSYTPLDPADRGGRPADRQCPDRAVGDDL
ncbi:MAG: DUF2911 domain-containing protein [Gemmatimonadota bacterium]|nr:DUF2911 domain-containing protein [Gemmatimonadota bacterium]